ncbi:hypothetical protein GCU67_07155 [Modestobacter muralis]|uniref:Uncharacterized protein n=1 Tax=Modestobacter muralis TaxID=1608614 RepID=A0A6P0ESY6_9ACTN|nr:hypothetical protein [Modestobacter muralis]NEK93953.1 hypothetical protein [Modestobacter muralis]NEN50720.1 hypothetical protein [Modestobacter muralis]
MSTQDWDAVPPYAGPPTTAPQSGPSWPPPQPYGQQAYGALQPYGQQPWDPPACGQPQWGQPQWPQPQGGQPPWGPAPWGPPQPWGPPARAERPGLHVAAAVLAFVSTVLVVVGTIWAMAFSALSSLARGSSAGISGWTALIQLVLAGLLVAGGVRVLGGSRRWLLGAAALQLALSLYWVAVLDDVAPATLSEGVFVLPAVFAVLALLAGGLPFLPELRRWLHRRSGRTAGEPQPLQQPEPTRPPWA